MHVLHYFLSKLATAPRLSRLFLDKTQKAGFPHGAIRPVRVSFVFSLVPAYSSFATSQVTPFACNSSFHSSGAAASLMTMSISLRSATLHKVLIPTLE